MRSLESTINGLEHTIAVGQGAGMEELTEAQISSQASTRNGSSCAWTSFNAGYKNKKSNTHMYTHTNTCKL